MSPHPPSSSAAALGRIEATIMAESALIDKESGRVFWEGGSSSTLSASLYPKIGVLGFSHLKATILTSLLLLALVGFLAHLLRQRLDAAPAVAAQDVVRPLHQSIGLFVLQWTLLRTPKLDENFVVFLLILYLMEAYTCSTRRYLANAITSPLEVEEYIEKLRSEPPVVTWKVRCFHYEKPYWLSPAKSAQAVLQVFLKRGSSKKLATTDENELPPVLLKESDNISGPFRRKVVSHQATANYTFSSFVDATTAGVWKRQLAISHETAPFMKIVLSKILVLADEDAKNDYFKQQSNFVTNEGMRDKFAEYSTNIEVEGFKRRMLAIRPVKGVPSAKLFRLNAFWFFTMLGLSLPYRLWFAGHCDHLRVTVVKETYAELAGKSSAFSSWFSPKAAPATPPPSDTTVKQIFRQQMQSLSLYAKKTEEQPALVLNNSTKVEDGEGEIARAVDSASAIVPVSGPTIDTSAQAPLPPATVAADAEEAATPNAAVSITTPTEGGNEENPADVEGQHDNEGPTLNKTELDTSNKNGSEMGNSSSVSASESERLPLSSDVNSNGEQRADKP